MKPAVRILLVEDEEFVRNSMTEVLEAEGFEVVTAQTARAGLEVFARERIDLVLTDLRLPDADGQTLVEDPGVQSATTPVIVITGHGTVEDAVAAMRAGAFDFLQKPVGPDPLVLAVRRALEHGRLVSEVGRLRSAARRTRGTRSLVGDSPAMQEVRRVIAQVAPTDATVLVSGESGTGKELVAAEVHHASARADGPLVLVNCAAVPASLFESEFFGHRRGAFSGAYADRTGRFAEAAGGTLVLDEVHTLPAEVQAKLLRVLETGEYQMVGESRTRVVDVRIVALTNEDLKKLVDEGEFRSDLYFRLDVFPVRMPPLREHAGDLEAIARELFARARARSGAAATPEAELDAEALAVLRAYPWPGNVRELRNVLERAAILAHPEGRVDAALLRGVLAAASDGSAGGDDAGGDYDLRRRLERAERRFLQEALDAAGGSKKEAAVLLGIDPKNISYYLRKHEVRDDSK